MVGDGGKGTLQLDSALIATATPNSGYGVILGNAATGEGYLALKDASTFTTKSGMSVGLYGYGQAQVSASSTLTVEGLGLDIGTQSAKAVIIDDALTVRGRGSAAYQPTFPHPGWAEQDPKVWLDALAPDEKALLQDAAVLGKVFWAGAVAAIGDHALTEVERSLHGLERKEFIRRERRSAVR